MERSKPVMAADDDDSSELSSLSSLSPAPSEDEGDGSSDGAPAIATKSSRGGILKFFPKLSEQPPKEPSPPPRKRSPSPPHDYILADNPDVARHVTGAPDANVDTSLVGVQFIVMFRSRFSDAFPKSLAHFGPQELERDINEPIPGDRVEHFLCALLGLLLNRKQDVKYEPAGRRAKEHFADGESLRRQGHYGRALEDAIASHKSQWAASWEAKNPLAGGATFNSMTPDERLVLLRTLILWTMASSETVKGLINQSYKQNRHEDDLNQPRSVQSWGSDGDKRRYFLIEGQDDSHFRVYRESNPAGTNRTWWSVAGSIEELKALADKLDTKDGGPKARKLSHKMMQAVPRFEAGEEKRRRREYRQLRKEQFKRPEPGFSLYEGRTRGKRMKYTYSDDEDIFSDSTGYRRSARNTGASTPAESGPVMTSSGRQVRAPPRLNMVAGDGGPAQPQADGSEFDQEPSTGPSARPRRAAATAAANGNANGHGASRSRHLSADSDADESEAEFGDDEEEEAHVPEESEDEDEYDEDEVMEDDDLVDQPQSLVVKLSVTSPKLRTVLAPIDRSPNMLPTLEAQDFKVNGSTPSGREVDMQDAPIQDSISVASESARKPPSQVTGEDRQAPSAPSEDRAGEPSLNGAAMLPVAPLAFRGSPEKPYGQAVPSAVPVPGQE
ncbi:hypothetical protein DCS_04859 [Drechmeria coniospora]|uniref:WHIM1 domain-containing protein n=1 Tax=Drechmeria coniospora TaxID=98403 RepID=A0A151GL83_DRECN|nr:hypothetical protein DCS_04859 [Drechmeria coniospora]KYK57846.1 hypothetical protein DCS_04859 [Drechmeria coniospora]